VNIYPDGASWKLRNALAEKFGLEMGNIIMGCGSNEVIEFIGHAFLKPGDNIITAEHAFLVYKLMAKVFGADTIEVPDPGYVHDLDAMAAAITPQTKEVFIANPNNPTGTLVTQEQIDRFMAKVPDHVVVVFDEAYYEFLDNPPDTLKYVREGRNVVVLRTFSKIQGLAGTRVGYGIANKELIDVLQRTRQPFNLNSVAQAGALAGLLDQEHQDKTKRITDEGRDYLQAVWPDGLEYIPSYANFVLVKVGDGNAVFKAMMDKGVIVRAMAAYKLPEWVRISIGTMPQNERLHRGAEAGAPPGIFVANADRAAPFAIRWQAVSALLLGAEPGTKGVGIVPADSGDRMVVLVSDGNTSILQFAPALVPAGRRGGELGIVTPAGFVNAHQHFGVGHRDKLHAQTVGEGLLCRAVLGMWCRGLGSGRWDCFHNDSKTRPGTLAGGPHVVACVGAVVSVDKAGPASTTQNFILLRFVRPILAPLGDISLQIEDAKVIGLKLHHRCRCHKTVIVAGNDAL
jgi:histidinol-phosphate aminotransferase